MGETTPREDQFGEGPFKNVVVLHSQHAEGPPEYFVLPVAAGAENIIPPSGPGAIVIRFASNQTAEHKTSPNEEINKLFAIDGEVNNEESVDRPAYPNLGIELSEESVFGNGIVFKTRTDKGRGLLKVISGAFEELGATDLEFGKSYLGAIKTAQKFINTTVSIKGHKAPRKKHIELQQMLGSFEQHLIGMNHPVSQVLTEFRRIASKRMSNHEMREVTNDVLLVVGFADQPKEEVNRFFSDAQDIHYHGLKPFMFKHAIEARLEDKRRE